MNITDDLKSGLKSMKQKPEPKHTEAICCPSDDGDRYMWGLRLDINNDAMEALGMTAKDFVVGEEVYLLAKCKVTSVSSRDSTKGGARDSADLQITDMKLHDNSEKPVAK